MMKRLLASLLILILSLSIFSTSLADIESYSFEPVVIGDLDSLATAGKAVQSSNRSFTAAALLLEHTLYQATNDIEIVSTPVWKDCVIGRKESIVSVAYDMDDQGSLVLVYDTVNHEIAAAIIDASPIIMKTVYNNDGYSSVNTVDGEEWSDLFQEMLQMFIKAFTE